MSAEQAAMDPTAAYEFALEQAWDIGRGMWAAYQVDTGEELAVAIAPWADLSPAQRLAFSVVGGELVRRIGRNVRMIGGTP